MSKVTGSEVVQNKYEMAWGKRCKIVERCNQLRLEARELLSEATALGGEEGKILLYGREASVKQVKTHAMREKIRETRDKLILEAEKLFKVAFTDFIVVCEEFESVLAGLPFEYKNYDIAKMDWECHVTIDRKKGIIEILKP
jgi:hypothetical protein